MTTVHLTIPVPAGKSDAVLKFLLLTTELLDYSGKLILSGILDQEEEIVRTALEKPGYHLRQIIAQDE